MTRSLKEPVGVCSTMAGGVGLGMASGVGVGVGAGVGAGVAVAAGVGAGVAATVAGVGVGVGSSPPQAATRARRAIMTKAVAGARHPGVRLGRRYRRTVVSPFAGCLWEWGYVSRLGVVL